MDNYKTLFHTESAGATGAFGLKIEVAATNLPDLKTEEIREAAYQASRLITAAVREAIKAKDADTPAEIECNRELLELFPEPIFVEEIPNGYCNDWCCKHLPWFVVTTEIGRFTIGHRKRVISIDWSDTHGTRFAEDLFPDENVTKYDRSIHAWSMEDAKRYVYAVLASAPPGE